MKPALRGVFCNTPEMYLPRRADTTKTRKLDKQPPTPKGRDESELPWGMAWVKYTTDYKRKK